MSVYIVMEHIYWNYEGGSDEVIGVFASRRDAFKRVRKDIPLAKQEKGKTSWGHPTPCADHHELSIQRWKVA